MIVATFFTHVFLKCRPEFSFNLQFKNSFDLLMKLDMYLKGGFVWTNIAKIGFLI